MLILVVRGLPWAGSIYLQFESQFSILLATLQVASDMHEE